MFDNFNLIKNKIEAMFHEKYVNSIYKQEENYDGNVFYGVKWCSVMHDYDIT